MNNLEHVFHTIQKRYKATSQQLLAVGVVFVGIIAVATSLYIFQKRGPVAPTAPESQPAAQEITSQNCSVNFEVAPDNQLTCVNQAFRDELDNSSGNYNLRDVIQTVRAGDTVVWNIQIENSGTETALVNIHDTFPFNLENYLSILDSNCSNPLTILTGFDCNQVFVGAGQRQNFTLRTRVLDTAPIGTIYSNTATVSTPASSATCSTSITVAQATEQIACNGTCQTDKECADNLLCIANGAGGFACRNPAQPQSTTCGVIASSTPTHTPTLTVTEVVNTATPTLTPTNTPILLADLAVTKTASSITPKLDDEVTFTITTKNNGPANTTDVQIRDTIPSGLEVIQVTESKGSYSASTGIWSIETLAVNEAVTLTVRAKVKTTGSITNEAVLVNTSVTDTDSTNNRDDVTLNSTRTLAQCNQTCTNNSDCANSTHICYNTGAGYACRLESNPTNSSCVSSSNTTNAPTATNQPAPRLPRAGFSNNTTLTIIALTIVVLIIGVVSILFIL